MVKLSAAQRSARIKVGLARRKETKRAQQDAKLGQINYTGTRSGRISCSSASSSNIGGASRDSDYSEGYSAGYRQGLQFGLEILFGSIRSLHSEASRRP